MVDLVILATALSNPDNAVDAAYNYGLQKVVEKTTTADFSTTKVIVNSDKKFNDNFYKKYL